MHFDFHSGIASRQSMEKSIGLLAMCLSGVLVIFNLLIFDEKDIQSSISHYYYTGMRNIFVSVLSFTAFFLFIYLGYNNRERTISNVAGIFALCVAWLPTSEMGTSDLIGKIHLVSAAIFFILMAVFPYFFFSQAPKESPQQRAKHIIYKASGLVVLFCLIVIGLQQFLFPDINSVFSFVFWAETIALFALGVSWLTKSGAFFKEPY